MIQVRRRVPAELALSIPVVGSFLESATTSDTLSLRVPASMKHVGIPSDLSGRGRTVEARSK